MSWLKKIFKKSDTVNTIIENKIDIKDEWIEFEKQKPPHEVVLAACDTHDCGWCMDTVWWSEKKSSLDGHRLT